MSSQHTLPGNSQQQSLLRILIALYEDSNDVQAVLLFGSLGRGAGDELSDLDVAVIVQDPERLDMRHELRRIEVAIVESGAPILCTELVGHDCYFVTDTLLSVAIDYYSLAAIDPYVLDGWHLLCGSLDDAAIQAAAQKNQHPGPTLSQQMRRALWLGLAVDVALQRGQFWRALPSLEKMRGALWTIFSASRGGTRHAAVFESTASREMQTMFGRTLPHYVPDSPAHSIHAVGDAFSALLDLLEHHLDELSNYQVQLGPGEREFITRLRSRQQMLYNAPKTACP